MPYPRELSGICRIRGRRDVVPLIRHIFVTIQYSRSRNARQACNARKAAGNIAPPGGFRRCPKLMPRAGQQPGYALGSTLIKPPAAKPPFSVRRRCKAKIDLAVFQYSFARFPFCALPPEKIQLFADGILTRADPSIFRPLRKTPPDVPRAFASALQRPPCTTTMP